MPTATASVVSKKKPKYIPESRVKTQYLDYEPVGNVKKIFSCKEPEVILSGPAGTGKSRCSLEKVNWLLEKYPRIRGAMVRKTRKSMTQSCMITFEEEVSPRNIRLDDDSYIVNPAAIPFHGGHQEYRYPNGSILYCAGLDDPTKLYSSQWDFVYVNQAEELTEDEWQQVGSRIRNGKMPFQQLIGDVNPADPQHWVVTRSASGVLHLIETNHQDNPVFWNSETKTWTERGQAYVVDKLGNLTGALKQRLYYGRWAAAEGAVYEESFNKSIHVIDRIMRDTDLRKDQVDKSWPRYWVVDFGYTNPFVWQAWAEDPDGRLIMYKEIYKTKTTVEDHAKKILEMTKDEPKPRMIITDHDAEDRATLEKHLGMSTKGAYKAVSIGIQSVETRLKIAGDGKARTFFMRDSLVEIDPALLEAKLPTCTVAEFDVYVWDRSANRKIKEEPVKKFDHGMDALRYIVAHVDQIDKFTPKMFNIISVTKSGGGGGGNDLQQTSAFRMPSSVGNKWGR